MPRLPAGLLGGLGGLLIHSFPRVDHPAWHVVASVDGAVPVVLASDGFVPHRRQTVLVQLPSMQHRSRQWGFGGENSAWCPARGPEE